MSILFYLLVSYTVFGELGERRSFVDTMVILGKFERDWTFIRQKRPFLARRMRKGNIRQCLLGKNIRHCLVGKIWKLVSEEKWPLKPVDAEEFEKEKKK